MKMILIFYNINHNISLFQILTSKINKLLNQAFQKMKTINTDQNTNYHFKKEIISSKSKCYQVYLILIILLTIYYKILCYKAQTKILMRFQEMINCKI